MLRLFRRFFITGLLIWTPIAITLWVIAMVLTVLDRSTGYLPTAWQAESLLGFYLPGFGIITTLFIIFLTGILAANMLGQTVLSAWEKLLKKIPIVKSIYTSVKQISDTLFSEKGHAFKHVVLIPYPNNSTWIMAFVTSDTPHPEIHNHIQEYMSVYVPTTPNPTSGFLLFVPTNNIRYLNISIDAALKQILSIGVILPTTPTDITSSNPEPLSKM